MKPINLELLSHQDSVPAKNQTVKHEQFTKLQDFEFAQ